MAPLADDYHIDHISVLSQVNVKQCAEVLPRYLVLRFIGSFLELEEIHIILFKKNDEINYTVQLLKLSRPERSNFLILAFFSNEKHLT